MWQRFAHTLVRSRWIVIVLWALAALAAVTLAPRLADVSLTNEIAFLPDDVPSQQAERALAERFPESVRADDGVLVLYRPDGLRERDIAYARDLVAWLDSEGAPDVVGVVVSPFAGPQAQETLQSPDGTVLLIPFELTAPPMSDAANQAVDAIRAHVQETRPDEVEVYVTGEAAINRDLMAAIIEGIDRTTIVTVVLVVVILLLIYRAPIAAGIPLVSIGVAFVVARGVLGWLAQLGLKVSSDTEAFLVVLIFGVGTDYALFLISRFREELARSARLQSADVEALSRVGPVIAASGAVVILGVLAMAVARFEIVKTRGPAMAVGVFVALLASLTLTPALLSILGNRLFWPFHRPDSDRGTPRSRLWAKVADAVAARPLVAALVTSALLVAPYVALPNMDRKFDILSELPAEREARRGFEIVMERFGAGEVMPTFVLVEAPVAWTSPEGLQRLAELHHTLARSQGVSRVRSLVDPLGNGEFPLALEAQLRAVASAIEAQAPAERPASPEEADRALREALRRLDDLRRYVEAVAQAHPDVAESSAYGELEAQLAAVADDVEAWRAQLRVANQVRVIEAQMGRVPAELSPEMLTLMGGDQVRRRLGGLRTYLSALGETHPGLRDSGALARALEALDTLEEVVTQAEAGLQLSTQMSLLARGFEAPSTPPTTPEEFAQAAAELQALAAYLEEVGRAYPEVQREPAYGELLQLLGQMASTLDAMRTGAVAPGPDVAQQMARARAQVAQDFRALAAFFSDQDAPFLSDLWLSRPEARAGLDAWQQALQELRTALAELRQEAASDDLLFVPPAEMIAGFGEAGGAEALSARQRALAQAFRNLAEAVPEGAYFWPGDLLGDEATWSQLRSAFVGRDGQTVLLQVLLSVDPYSTEARLLANRLEQEAGRHAEGLGGRVLLGGATAQSRDVWTLMDQDLWRVAPAVVLSVWAVLVLLLGSLVAPVYLVATVVLSYGTTMGLVTWLFQDVLAQGGVNHTIPLVILVLLVALGADYNIFLVSRVWEEAERLHDLREGVRVASAYTGRVITSAGIILAGTFAALMVSPMQSLFQIGATVALGVLIDTFIVRGVLVPALVALVGRLNWWPAPRPLGHGGIFRLLFARFL